jgi:hypothetical protein
VATLTRGEQAIYEKLRGDVTAAVAHLFPDCFPEGVPAVHVVQEVVQVKEEEVSEASEPSPTDPDEDGREPSLEPEYQDQGQEEGQSQAEAVLGDFVTVSGLIVDVPFPEQANPPPISVHRLRRHSRLPLGHQQLPSSADEA